MAKSISEQLYYESIKYTLIRERIKNTYIQIKDGKVFVKAPRSASINYIEKLLEEKKNWILKKLEEQSKTIKAQLNYQDGDKISVLGKTYTLRILYNNNKRSKIYSDSQHVYCEFNKEIQQLSNAEKEKIPKKLIEKYYRYIATQEVFPAIEDLQKRTGLYPSECNIKNLKATWGICSSKRKISINLNLMAYSRHAIEYVCLHELCHLKYMNHSKDFWNLVEHYMPDYKLAKKELKS